VVSSSKISELTGRYKSDRSSQIYTIGRVRGVTNDLIRKQVLYEDRLDVLAELVGKRFDNFHWLIYDFQVENKTTLQLAPRGWGKSTIGTVLSAAQKILRNRDIRILFTSETATQAQNFLSELKGILIHEKVIEVFGDVRGDVWHENAINVLGRSPTRKENTVMTTGVDGSITSAHFDCIYGDDLVTLKNSRTELNREKVKRWFFTTLMPCITDESTEFRIIGTRYHPDDLYNHLMKHDPKFKNTAQIVPALDPETDQSNNPEIYRTEWLHEQRESMGRIYFNSQFNQDPSGVQGSIFDSEFFRYVNQLPKKLIKFQGVDLAVGREKEHAKFAITTIGVDPRNFNIYVIDYFSNRISLKRQDEVIFERWDYHNALAVGMEANAFQVSKLINLKEDEKYSIVPLLPIYTEKDKITRAQMLQVRFERGEIFFLESERDGELVEHLLAVPDSGRWDLFDSLFFAVQMAFSRRKKKRRKREPGVIGVGKTLVRRS
jgi:phage terminase large subunit-like protein